MSSDRSSGPPAKPRLRGVSHQFAFFVFLAANTVLLASVDVAGRPAVWVYAGSLGFLYAVSSTYHRRDWTELGRKRMRSLDHSGIFVLIAGSYSPLFMTLADTGTRNEAMWLMWGLAAVGVTKSLLWAHGPKWITAALAIGMGWSAVVYALELAPIMGSPSIELLLASGVVYTLGGIIYALKRPDPFPTVFGYHEVFHACVIAGSLTHYAHTLLVLRAGGHLPI